MLLEKSRSVNSQSQTLVASFWKVCNVSTFNSDCGYVNANGPRSSKRFFLLPL